jgi:hypothetical protein
MTKGYIKSESYIVLPNGVEISNGKYNRFKYRKEVISDKEIKGFKNSIKERGLKENEK